MSTLGQRPRVRLPAPAARGTPRARKPAARRVDGEIVPLRSVLAVPIVAVVTVIFAIVATQRAGITFGDPDNALWVLFALSAIATIHLGWHYVIDDVTGVAIALLALGTACYLTGFDGRRGAAAAPAAAPTPAP